MFNYLLCNVLAREIKSTCMYVCVSVESGRTTLGYDLHSNENESFVTTRAVPAATAASAAAAARLPTCCGAKFIFSSLHQVETGIFHFHRALGFSGVRVFFAVVPIVPDRFELLSLVIVRAQLLIEIEFFVRDVFAGSQSIRRVITGDSLLLRLPKYYSSRFELCTSCNSVFSFTS